MQVGHERQRAAPLRRSAGEDDRAGLGDRGGAAGECAVDVVQLVCAQPVILDEIDAGGPQGQLRRDRQPADAAFGADAADRNLDLRGVDPRDHRAIVADAVAEELRPRLGVERARRGGRSGCHLQRPRRRSPSALGRATRSARRVNAASTNRESFAAPAISDHASASSRPAGTAACAARRCESGDASGAPRVAAPSA